MPGGIAVRESLLPTLSHLSFLFSAHDVVHRTIIACPFFIGSDRFFPESMINFLNFRRCITVRCVTSAEIAGPQYFTDIGALDFAMSIPRTHSRNGLSKSPSGRYLGDYGLIAYVGPVPDTGAYV